MKVYTVHEPERQSTRVYLELGANADGVRWFKVPSGPPVEVIDGAEPPLYLIVPDNIAAALADAIAPRPEATERHLDDAIEVRDRLLALVERTTQPRATDPPRHVYVAGGYPRPAADASTPASSREQA